MPVKAVADPAPANRIQDATSRLKKETDLTRLTLGPSSSIGSVPTLKSNAQPKAIMRKMGTHKELPRPAERGTFPLSPGLPLVSHQESDDSAMIKPFSHTEKKQLSRNAGTFERLAES